MITTSKAIKSKRTVTHKIGTAAAVHAAAVQAALAEVVRRAPDRAELDVPRIMSSHAFRMSLKKEIRRADRSQTSLTILIFGVELPSEGEAIAKCAWRCLAAVVPAQTRRTDVVGWFDEKGRRRLGVTLYRADTDQAWRVIKSVRRQFDAEMTEVFGGGALQPRLSFEIFAYPATGLWDRDRPRQLTLFDAHGRPAIDSSATPAAKKWTGPQIVSSGSFVVSPASTIMAHPHPAWKRSLDFVGAALSLIVLSPLFLAVGLAVRLTSKGPVFFKQERVGHRGRLYTCWKFRTMAHKYDTRKHQDYLKTLIRSGASGGNGQAMQKMDAGNSQITPVGRFLRKTCLDELPQLINVLRGEMSLVGPRPCLPYEAAEYLCWHTRRFDSVPGMTGLWQVRGKNRTTFKEMIRLDIAYGLQQSLWFDLLIIVQTIPSIIREALRQPQKT